MFTCVISFKSHDNTENLGRGIIPILRTGNLELWEINDLPKGDMDGQT